MTDALRDILARVEAAPGELAAILDASPEPMLAFDASRAILAANEAGARFFGYAPRELAGLVVDVIVPERLRQPDPPPPLVTPDLTTVELPGLRRDGSELSTVWTFGAVVTPSGPVFVMRVRDKSELARRERELEIRYAAIFENTLDGIILSDDGRRVVDVNPAASRLLQRERDDLVGQPTAQLVRGAANAIPEAGASTGESQIVLPDGRVRRVEFGAVANVEPGIHLTVFRDVEDRARAGEAQRFLDDASRLLSTSLDYNQTLASLVRLAVPRLADWAAVEMLQPDGSLRRVALFHADPAKVALADEVWRRLPPTTNDPSGVGAVVRTGQPELTEAITPDMFRAAFAHVPDVLDLYLKLDLASSMIAPLPMRGRTVGALYFVSAESRRRFTPADLSIAVELARRAGYALDNALFVGELRDANRAKDLYLARVTHLQELATDLVGARTIEDIADRFSAIDRATPLGALACALFALDAPTGEILELASTTNDPAFIASRDRITAVDDNPVAAVCRDLAPIWIADRTDFAARFPDAARGAFASAVSRAFLPLLSGPDCVGVLAIAFRDRRTFDPDERAYLGAVANLWAQALHRARLAAAERDALQRALDAEASAMRKKDEFLAMVGHELRNPLAPIVTATSLIRARGRAAPRELEILERQSRHLVRLVDDLLDISRVTSGKLSLHRARVDLAEVVAQAVESTTPTFGEKGIRFSSAVATTPMIAFGDRDRLVQVVTNVLVNAAKFTPSGKAVSIAADVRDGAAVIEIRDEGQGIDAELLPQVFDLFTQGRQGTDRRTGGLGLGLAIARSIVVAHGGSIEATSAGPDRGATVTIRFPLTAATGESANGTTAIVPGDGAVDRAAARRSILVVDDNEDSAEMLAVFLDDSGYETRVAHDAREALALVRERPFDLAILDIGLPDVDGYELAHEIHETLGDRAPKLVALTGYAQEADRARALSNGFVEHLAKPVDMTRLTAMIDRLVA